MDSQLLRTHAHRHEQDPDNVGLHSVAEDDHEHHHEKKSVLKKVKAKAKKIKDTFKLHGHNHDHDHADHVPDDQDLDEEVEEDDERFEDSEVHGAPIYESTALRFTAIPGQVQSSGQSPGIDFERSKVDIGKSTVQVEEIPEAPRKTLISDPGKPRVNLGDFEEDPHGQNIVSDSYNPSNYQTKVTDPTRTGGEEAGITPILHYFDKMNISQGAEQKRETEQKQRKPIEPENQFPNLPTGSHDLFNPQPGPPISLKTKYEPPLIPQGTNLAASQDNPHDATAEKPSSQSSYTEKISSVTTSIADKALTAKNAVASKLGYGEKDGTTRAHDTREGEETAKPVSAVEYEKLAETGNTVMPKMKVSQSTNGNEDESKSEIKGQDKGVSMKDYFAEKLRPGEEDRALSAVISDALRKQKKETKPMGKVTESEEVARRLGTTDDKSQDSGSVNGPGKGVVDKVRGAVSSWFNKGDESQPTQQSLGSSHGE
ncbi:stress-responsive family protein [Tripterygium wilfordii]|uniref:Stress-responsive family protein n=1 Tax=Tripterygium wilfordii TaxID=458696 RepID=A0A7J7DB03_TRIWF|nr:low-temperature-induced 65 kDa protein [Tripterygium wilfordii]KAF5743537.1 stress-responsive family protein [Tripterygium wilfordii]